MHSRIYRCAAVACLVLTSWCWGTEESKDSKEAEKEPTFHLGAGGLVSTKPYAGVDAKVYPVPLVAYEGKRFYMRGVQGGYRLFSNKGLSIGPIVQPRFDGFGEDDSPALAGMQDRNWSVDGGVGVEAITGIGLFGLSLVTDLLGRHRGQEVEFGYTIMFPVLGFDFIPTAGVRWKSDNLVDYYYGVRANEVRPGRPLYEGEAATDPFLRLAVRRKLTEHWSLLGAVQYEWLADKITDSPIVDKDHEMSFLASVLYSW
jgi:outer membrane protein